MEKELLTCKDLAAYFGKSQDRIWVWARTGIIPKPFKIAGSTYWRKSTLDSHLQKMEDAA